MTVTIGTSPVQFQVRQGRNLLALAILLPLTVAALTVAYQQRADLGPGHWWVLVFPALASATAYRIANRRVPLSLDADSVRVSTGHTLLGLRTTIPWAQVKRIRVTAAGMLLIEMRDSARWATDKPWLVRANLRTNERKYHAAVIQPLRELAGTPQQIVERVQAAAPVRVDAPEALRAPG
jgi:hypothetical protein